MKKSISVVAIAAVFAAGSAFTAHRQLQQWNVDHPEVGTPGIFFLSEAQVKALYCPGLNNVECAYLVGNQGDIVKKPQ
jgi:hypothetical protein